MRKLLLFAVLCIVVCTAVSGAGVDILDVSGYHNGGSCTSISKHSWDSADGHLMRFGSNTTSYNYGAASTVMVSLGKTGYKQQSSTGDSGRVGTFDASTTGMINIFDTAALQDDKTHVAESACEENMIMLYGGTTGQYPSHQEVEIMAGMMASGTGTRYTSDTSVQGDTLEHEYTAKTDQGYHYTDLKGTVYSGWNKTTDDLNFRYDAREHTVSNSEDDSSLDDAFSYSWNGYEYEDPEDNSTVTESISEDRLEEFVNQTEEDNS